MDNSKLKITEKIQGFSGKDAFFSFEFFPPKTQQGLENLKSRIQRMTQLGPLFVTVTWGVGGSTAEKSLKLAEYAQKLGNTVCLHLTCTNMDRRILDYALKKAKKHGICNVLALRGDPPRNEEYGNPSASEFVHAVDLVKYIRSQYGDYFCIGVAGYPEGHVDGSDISDQDPVKDLPFLEQKVKAGADFIITQLFYDVEKFLAYEEKLRNYKSGIFKNVILIPGLMPINTYQSFIRASNLSHASVPDSLIKDLNKIKGNDELVKQLGVDALASIAKEVYERTNGRIRGFHFYTLNLERSIALILESCNIFQTSKIFDEGSGINTESFQVVGTDSSDPAVGSHSAKKPIRLIESAYNRVIIKDNSKNDRLSVPEDHVGASTDGPSRPIDFLAISAGEGALGRQANWDDFPNGRFGDSRSPAFGEIDGYGPSLRVDNKRAYKLWQYPTAKKDIDSIFISHIMGKLTAIPWSDQSLDPETGFIQEQLIEMNKKGMWTISSQPACDSVRSDDKIFGWGPSSGWVFQKAFVEFFIPSDAWRKLKTEKLDRNDMAHLITYYAYNYSGDFMTNEFPASSNAVTWGVFPNREILQSTLIERESFTAWGEEAFCLWKKWQELYEKESPSYKLLQDISNDYYLVTIIHHDFKNEFGLWDFLLK